MSETERVDDMPRRECRCPVRSDFNHNPDCPAVRAAQEVAREWVTIDLLDTDESGRLALAIGSWLSEVEIGEGLRTRRTLRPSINDLAVLLEVLVGAVANTYEDAEEFSAHVIEALATGIGEDE